jgi:serine protease Do
MSRPSSTALVPTGNGTRESTSPDRPRRRRLLAASLAALSAAAVIFGVGAFPSFQQPGMNMTRLSATALAAEPARRSESSGPRGFADIVSKVTPAVFSVRVKVEKRMTAFDGDEQSDIPQGSPFERFFRQFGNPGGQPGKQVVIGQGSGFFISADGYAVTNNHVVEGARTVEIAASDGKTYRASVVGVDPQTDLALLKVDGGRDFPYVSFSDASPRVGDWVLAVGNPFGLSETVTAGIVSARGRDIGAGPYDDFLQIDAPINKGNSGGPAFDVDGRVVGVNSAIYSPSGGSVGIGFAIPADTVKSVVSQLKDGGKVVRGWIGVEIQKVTPDIADGLGMAKAEGALVAAPQRGSPAAKAGIEAGDVITSVNGAPIKDAHELARTISGMAPGTSARIGLLRHGRNTTVSLTLGKLPSLKEARADPRQSEGRRAADATRLGLSLAPASSVAGAGESGVVVAAVDPSGPAAEHGLQTGDIILDVGGKAVSTPVEVHNAVRDARKSGKRTVLFRVQSGEASRFVALPVG